MLNDGMLLDHVVLAAYADTIARLVQYKQTVAR